MSGISIEELEQVLWSYFTTTSTEPFERDVAISVTDELGQRLADFLIAHGVDVSVIDGPHALPFE